MPEDCLSSQQPPPFYNRQSLSSFLNLYKRDWGYGGEKMGSSVGFTP